MKLILCVDSNMGMLFNNRRQSSDKVLIEHIYNLVNGRTLWINEFSEELFKNGYEYYLIEENNFEDIEEEDFLFIENVSLNEFESLINEIIIYDWNRVYPADKYFDINLENWDLESEIEIRGHSHERITQKIYKRGAMNE